MAMWGCYQPNGLNDREALDHFRRSATEGSSVLVEAHAAAGAPLAANVLGCEVAVQGSPRNRLDPDRTLTPEEIVQAYLQRGGDSFAELCGPFAIAIIEHAARRAVLAIDRMGIERLTYSAQEDRLWFGTRADVLASVPGRGAEISRQRLYDFLFFHMIPAPATVFEGIDKLEPGNWLQWQNGRCTLRSYAPPRFTPDRSRSEEDFAIELRECLEQSVVAARPDDRTGAFLSGGLDSSTVAGYLSRVSDRARTFSIGFGVPGYDELEYARIASRHFGCESHEYVVTPQDILGVFPRVAQAYDEPFGNSSAVPALLCAELAKRNGVDHLLAGDGGDELFAGNERYAKQSVFEAYGRIPAALRRLIDPVVALIDPATRVTPLRKLRSYVDQANIPLPERLETWNYAYREGVSTMLHADFAAAIDPTAPIAQMEAVYQRAEADHPVDRMLAYDWHFTLADSDIRKVSSMCEAAGVRVSYPMLDHRLVDLATRIPPEMKMRRLQLRSFYKNATRGFLPDAIINKQKHGFGLPFGHWMKTDEALADLIFGRLQNLKNRHIFRNGFIDELIEDQRSGHAAYFGVFVWDLAILEEWLHNHEHAHHSA